MAGYKPKALLILCAFYLLFRCSFPIFLLVLIFNTTCIIYSRLLSVTRLAHIYALLTIPYYAILFLSFFLDILRFCLSTFQIPWVRILALEGLALALLLFNYLHSSTTHTVRLFFYSSYSIENLEPNHSLRLFFSLFISKSPAEPSFSRL